MQLTSINSQEKDGSADIEISTLVSIIRTLPTDSIKRILAAAKDEQVASMKPPSNMLEFNNGRRKKTKAR